jgi:hypothetical protein
MLQNFALLETNTDTIDSNHRQKGIVGAGSLGSTIVLERLGDSSLYYYLTRMMEERQMTSCSKSDIGSSYRIASPSPPKKIALLLPEEFLAMPLE